MQNTPKSLRLQIAITGRTNAGKSSFLNLVCGQNVAITSDIAGTTTDVVEKAMELPPLGPVLFMDTAGFGDETDLKNQRLEKTISAIEKADIILLVCENDKFGEPEEKIITLAQKNNTPLIKIYNKADNQNDENASEEIRIN